MDVDQTASTLYFRGAQPNRCKVAIAALESSFRLEKFSSKMQGRLEDFFESYGSIGLRKYPIGEASCVVKGLSSMQLVINDTEGK